LFIVRLPWERSSRSSPAADAPRFADAVFADLLATAVLLPASSLDAPDGAAC
jgi:hypothetical protein